MKRTKAQRKADKAKKLRAKRAIRVINDFSEIDFVEQLLAYRESVYVDYEML